MSDRVQDQEAFRASASRLVAARYPHALGSLLGGSAARGRASTTSDLDVAVLLPDHDHSGREVVRHEGRPAELFLNTVADHVLREAAHLLTAHHNAWTGIGKWLPRRLLSADPVLGRALLDGHRAVAEHSDPTVLAAAAEQVLGLLGGPVREGYAHRWKP